MAQRHRALLMAAREYGYDQVIWKVNALAVLQKNGRYGPVYRLDQAWLSGQREKTGQGTGKGGGMDGMGGRGPTLDQWSRGRYFYDVEHSTEGPAGQAVPPVTPILFSARQGLNTKKPQAQVGGPQMRGPQVGRGVRPARPLTMKDMTRMGAMARGGGLWEVAQRGWQLGKKLYSDPDAIVKDIKAFKQATGTLGDLVSKYSVVKKPAYFNNSLDSWVTVPGKPKRKAAQPRGKRIQRKDLPLADFSF